MDQPSQHIPAMHLLRPWCWQWLSDRLVGRSQTKASMRSLAVVMLDVHTEHSLEVPLAEDEHPIEALGPDRPDPALPEGVGLGSTYGREDHLRLVALEHRVEARRVLRVSVPNQEPEGRSFIGQFEREVSRLLGDPSGIRIPGGAEHPNAPRGEFDHEQDVERLQPHGLQREEITRQNAAGLAAQELASRWARPTWSRPESIPSQEQADLRGRHPDAELGQLAPDPDAAPPRVLATQSEDQAPSGLV